MWVDTGFPLRVIGREGEWLQVSSSRLKTRGASVWVPAARVGSHLPGTVGIAYSREGSSTVPEGESLLLEVAGSEGIGVHIGCRIVQPGKDDFIDLIDETPLNLDVGGPAADCLVRKLDDSGEIDVALRTAKGETVVTASTSAPHGAVHVRTDGPWGSAFGSWLSRGFVFLPAIVFPPGNPVLPPGNPVPPLGSQMPALGNPVPALGNPVPPFQQSPVPSFQQSPVQPFHQSPMRAP